MVQHSASCAGGTHDDAAKRASDIYRLHRAAKGMDAVGRWFAAALADGQSDGVLYDSRHDAVLHQHHNEQYYAFICIGPYDMDVCSAAGFLEGMRLCYGSGLTDRDHPAGGRVVIPRNTREEHRSLMRSIQNKGRTRPSGLVYPGE